MNDYHLLSAAGAVWTLVLLTSPSIIIYGVVQVARMCDYAAYPYLLFLGSYLPLYPVLFWQTIGQKYVAFGITLPSLQLVSVELSIFAIISINLLGVASLYLGMILILASQRAGQTTGIEVVKDITPVANEYVLVYIYPLLLLNYAKLFDITLFLLIFTLIAIIQVRTKRYMVNPLLVLFNYHFYQIEINGKNAFLLSRRDFDENEADEISQITISNNVRVHTGRI